MGEHPDYGPRGYLPDRAARRARKIVLREQLGLGWVVASVLAGALLLGVGAAFVWRQVGPPAPPHQAAADLAQLPVGTATRVPLDGADVLLVRTGSGVAAFDAPDGPVALCAASGAVESRDGRVWSPDGRVLSDHGESLRPLAATVHRGTVYVDPTGDRPAPEPRRGAAVPRCPPPA